MLSLRDDLICTNSHSYPNVKLLWLWPMHFSSNNNCNEDRYHLILTTCLQGEVCWFPLIMVARRSLERSIQALKTTLGFKRPGKDRCESTVADSGFCAFTPFLSWDRSDGQLWALKGWKWEQSLRIHHSNAFPHISPSNSSLLDSEENGG